MQSPSPIGPDEPTWPGYTAPAPGKAPAPQPRSQPVPAPPPYAGGLPGSWNGGAQWVVPRLLLGLSQIVAIGVGIVEAGLLLRIALLLLAANPSAGFSSWIYGLTAPLVAPFAGVFPDLTVAAGVLETPAILALIVYAIVGRIVESILHLLARL